MPCPLCGGLVHPVAGRCKHCKEDLTSFRAARPHAAAALPSLNGGATTSNGTTGTNGHAVATAAPLPIATHEASQPILPPRTTARSVPVQRPHSMWRSWPMLVIVLAVIAIVAATVIMILPPDTEHSGGKMSAPPAPERMQTDPLPDDVQGQLDPWASPRGAVPAQPARPQPQQPPPSDPLDQDQLLGRQPDGMIGGLGTRGAPGTIDPQDLADPDPQPPHPGGGVVGGVIGGSLGTAGADFMLTVIDHACTKLKACPGADQSSLAAICDGVAMMPKQPLPANCAAAQRCLDAIDRLSCTNARSTSPLTVLTMFEDCTEAVNRC